MNLKTYFSYLLLILILISSCSSIQRNKESEKDNYVLVTSEIDCLSDNDLMIFPDGDYIYRYAVNGDYSHLTLDDLIREYYETISLNFGAMPLKEGLVHIQYCSLENYDNRLINRYKLKTEEVFKKNVSIISSTKEYTIFKIH